MMSVYYVMPMPFPICVCMWDGRGSSRWADQVWCVLGGGGMCWRVGIVMGIGWEYGSDGWRGEVGR